MTHLFQKIATVTAIGGIALLAAGMTCYAVGARINTSRSIAVGLYWTSDKRPAKGDYVMVCPPQVGVMLEARQRGYLAPGICPGGYGYLMKKILAAAGDEVSIDPEGVRVNSRLLPFSRPLIADAAGRPLPRFQAATFILGASEVMLMSDVSDTSFDARYFGPLDRAQIKTAILPVFTW